LVFAPLTIVVFFHFLEHQNNKLGIKINQILKNIGINFLTWSLAFVIAVNFFYTYGYSYLFDVSHNWHTIAHPYPAQIQQLLAQIPSNATISASSTFLPHLSQRQKIYVLPKISDADYIIFEYCYGICGYWPAVGVENIEEIRQFLINNPAYKVKLNNQAGIIFERINEINEDQKSN